MSRLYDGEKDSLIICSSSIAAGRFKNDDDKRTISALYVDQQYIHVVVVLYIL